ncbi:AraC family transcriptional regulator [Enterobacter sp. HG048]|uniref:AraC family ligand binding domain-containing protein n=1 Tax=Enterobacter sp. HG048 TaxID=2969756 RepID=UPI0021510443|nr:AraC family transcriptional regulator [Enterobacter sp. HG048]MCR6468396.1 AraC family transcriptional regulator [Enterobacter sp. HG048]
MANDWLELRQHADTGIETIKAHFEGHAFDPHWHDSYLVGITLSGTQQFNCRRERHRSQPGDAFLLEPGEIHDGDAPVEGGFTYSTFYLDERWLTRALQGLYESTPGSYSPHFAQTLTREPQLVRGDQPVDVAAAVGFADQSHLGRWFQRAYRISPAHYRRLCTNLPDVSKK